jgi:hypothetical protein
MVEKDALKKGIHTAADLKDMGDYAGDGWYILGSGAQ